MDANGLTAIFGYLIWLVLKEIRNNLVALRLQNDPSFVNLGWVKFRRMSDGSIETITSEGFKAYSSEEKFIKKTGRKLA